MSIKGIQIYGQPNFDCYFLNTIKTRKQVREGKTLGSLTGSYIGHSSERDIPFEDIDAISDSHITEEEEENPLDDTQNLELFDIWGSDLMSTVTSDHNLIQELSTSQDPLEELISREDEALVGELDELDQRLDRLSQELEEEAFYKIDINPRGLDKYRASSLSPALLNVGRGQFGNL